MINIKPIGDRILVKSIKEEEATVSGIILPDTIDKEKKAQGEVVALGNGETISKLGLKIGDKILYKKWGGEDIKLNQKNVDEEYKILYIGKEEDKSDVIAIIE